MKARNVIIAAVAMLAFSAQASAQKKIKEAFAEIEKYAGVTRTGEQNTSRCVDSLGITSESSIVTLLVKKDYYGAVIDKLNKAFESESKNATMTENEIAGDRPDYDPIAAQMLGQRRQWSVWREDAEPVLVGGMGNSCYIIANFNDKKHPDYRTCYAAEWSRSAAPDVYKARLVYVYGRKPYRSQPVQYQATAKWPADVRLPGNIFDQSFGKAWADGVHSGPQDIPLDGDLTTWMNKAMNNVKHLSNSDWHRFFGLLTQQMMDKADKKSMNDLVVAAGIILDLCKNAGQLDNDEREVSARRLEDVSEHYFTGDKNQYIYDLLMLGAKKLKAKEKE